VKVYFISGLAADERVFRHILLSPQHEVVHLSWIEPFKNESLKSYALRLSEKIDTKEKFALIGLSFGGMIASEIAKHLRPDRTILISSIPSSRHLPVYYKFARNLSLHRIFPVFLIKEAAKLKRIFTTETSEDKLMLREMIRDADNRFIRWALNAILTWDNEQIPSNFIHLHGSHDEVLPRRFTKPTHVVADGGHLMVMTKAGEINNILHQALAD
jgi:pimeloyl-ACP methyl ester carboxylesterase